MKTIKEQLNEIREQIIELILKEEYEFISIESRDSDGWFEVAFKVEGAFFRLGIESTKFLVCEFESDVMISNSKKSKQLAKFLMEKHWEPVRKSEIQKKINELQKQL